MARLAGFGFKVSVSGFRVSGFGFRVSGFGFQVSGFGFRVSGSGVWVSGFRFRVSGFGFRVSGFMVEPGRGLERTRFEHRSLRMGGRFRGLGSQLFLCEAGEESLERVYRDADETGAGSTRNHSISQLHQVVADENTTRASPRRIRTRHPLDQAPASRLVNLFTRCSRLIERIPGTTCRGLVRVPVQTLKGFNRGGHL